MPRLPPSYLLTLSAALLSTSALAQTAPPPPTAAPSTAVEITLTQAMADPDWIGPPVEDAWWAWDGEHVQYQLKRADSYIRDTWQLSIDGIGTPIKVEGAARAQLDSSQRDYDATRARMAFARNGDIFVRDLRSGALLQVTRSDQPESRPQWSDAGNLVFRAGNTWFQWRPAQGTTQAALVLAEKDPAAEPEHDGLRERQLATFETLRKMQAREDAAREESLQRRRLDPSRAPLPVYLGDEVKIIDSALSPDAKWLLVVTQAKDADAGQTGKMPKYITESGYEEFEEVRTRVGRNAPLPQRLWLVDVERAEVVELEFDGLPGVFEDPLAKLRRKAGMDPLQGMRAVRVETDGDGSGPAIHWSDDGRQAAVMLRAVDNKDRWIASVSPASVPLADVQLQPRHRLTDPGWINWTFNAFGWTGDGQLWLLSEQSGYSHLYLGDGNGFQQLTSGHWEASRPQLAADGQSFYFICNRNWPGDYEVCNVGRGGGAVREITSLDGVESFAISPDGSQLLVRHSDSYMPPQLAVVPTNGDGPARLLTDTRSAQFKSYDWIQPQIVQVPSSHGAGEIWGKYYGPETLQPGKQYPIVLFVHGAGYLQNVHDRWPVYFREQMFNNLLVDNGYIVLDLDYRASKGYGRDWRTAIYRNMGTPELQDYLDGLDWLVANRQGDRERVGIYGGSYGGFMTFMALFKKPGVFDAGAALRPVSDWTQYNHEYTSNILNTPQLDPVAYARSSPIEFAAGLEDHLLIAHGMMDNNVFYKGSVMLAQKLIELRKDDWELASYPLERHGFVHPDSWFDEYRRVFELFEENL